MNDILSALVVIALVATLAVLLAGVVEMARGGTFKRMYGSALMRARIVRLPSRLRPARARPARGQLS